MLVRKLLSARLARYYAQPANAVVGSYNYNPQDNVSLPFSSLWGEWHWKRLYQRLCEQQQGQFLTPVELFRPYYSNALGNFIAKTLLLQNELLSDTTLEILEVGGGRGTNAHLILEFLQNHYPKLYESCHYTIADSSPSLHMFQKEVFQSSPHREKVTLKLLDLFHVAEGHETLMLPPNTASSESSQHIVVLALEVFDNLPHDKVRVRPGGRGETVMEQAEILYSHDVAGDEVLQEVFRPLNDPLLDKILDMAPWYASSTRSQPTWVPSVSCGTLLQLAQGPLSTLLVADFDWLPAPDRFDPSIDPSAIERTYIPGEGEPLVTCMDGYDHPCYLHAPEKSDILFPTNFPKLAAFCRRVFPASNVTVHKQGSFLHHYGILEEMQHTKSWITGYSPLFEDFSNCSVLTLTRLD